MKKIFRYMMLAGFLFCLGCNDWLDVNPKTESREEVQYSTESGFKDVCIFSWPLKICMENR